MKKSKVAVLMLLLLMLPLALVTLALALCVDVQVGGGEIEGSVGSAIDVRVAHSSLFGNRVAANHGLRVV